MRCESSTSTLVDLLVKQTSEQGIGTAYVFLDDRGELSQISYAQLDERARAIAARLQSQLVAGDRALLVYPAGLEFITAFFGCLYAGVIPVPATYPKPKRPMPRLNRIALDCAARVTLSTAPTLTTLDPNLLSGDAATSQWIATDEIDDAWADDWQPPLISGSDVAFLQYTSGSTSDPKGVMVSHANLLNNLECIRQAFGIGDGENHIDATGVFWLPAYHDMGLIGGLLTPMYMGGRSVLMSPNSFLQHPIRWLQAIDEYEASISGAPNFAYEYCVRRTSEEERAGLDLSRWRLAFCGAEPIRADTLQHFGDAFRPAGFQLDVFYPCYGLAETTLLAAGPDYRQEPRILAVNRAALAAHRVVPARGEPAEMTQRLVGCGQPVPDHDIAIVDPATDVPCQPGAVGEILIQGPSVAQGYWNRPEETEQTFGARVVGRPGRYLRTGDLGFFRDGDLFVTGRLKDVIIIRGRNHYPQDIEQTAEQSHPAVLPGAAFALTENDQEQLVVVHQLDRQYRNADLDEVVRAIRRSIVEGHDLDPYAIVLIRQTSLPVTSSGKVQRNLCREQYQADQLKVVHLWKNPVAAAKSAPTNGHAKVHVHQSGVAWSPSAGKNGNGIAAAAPLCKPSRAVRAVDVDRAAERIETWLLRWLVERLQLAASDVQRDRPFAEFGVDSMTAVELSQELEAEFQVPLPPIVAWNYPTPAALARYLAQQQMGAEQQAGIAAESNDEAPQRNGAAGGPAAVAGQANDAQLAALLAEIENLSDDEATRLLAEEGHRG
jgi:acyl-CoA synthetase (AMP-forming)/AMP-acid ligase II/acyl carrier protein